MLAQSIINYSYKIIVTNSFWPRYYVEFWNSSQLDTPLFHELPQMRLHKLHHRNLHVKLPVKHAQSCHKAATTETAPNNIHATSQSVVLRNHTSQLRSPEPPFFPNEPCADRPPSLLRHSLPTSTSTKLPTKHDSGLSTIPTNSCIVTNHILPSCSMHKVIPAIHHIELPDLQT